MLALISTWIGLATLGVAVTMLVHRPFMTDLTITLVLYFGAPGAMCLAGLELWSLRKESGGDDGVGARRLQALVAIGLSLAATTIAYGLIIFAEKIGGGGGLVASGH